MIPEEGTNLWYDAMVITKNCENVELAHAFMDFMLREESAELSSDFLSGPIGAFLSRFLPRLSDRGLDFDIRKYAHMFEYFCLGVGVCLFFSEALEKRWPAFFSAVAFCFLYACSDELHQSFVPGRAALFSDVLIDGAGYLLGPALTALLYPRRKSDPGV